MEVIAFLFPFVLLGVAVLFVAFSGGPSAARETYLTRGGRGFGIAIILIYVACGVGVPAYVLLNSEESLGGVGALRTEEMSASDERGKTLFRQQCASCHTLGAVGARGITGPNLDRLGELSVDRVVNAIKMGGTGQQQMPAGLLEGVEAEEVAEYVSKVAGSN